MKPIGSSMHARCEGPTVQLCGDIYVTWKKINDEFDQKTNYKKTTGTIQKIPHCITKQISILTTSWIITTDQEADHWANIGAQRKQKNNHRQTRRYRDLEGDTLLGWKLLKDSGRNGCGIVINGIDKEKWVTRNKIAIPLKVCTTMTAEIVGVCVLTNVLDLILCKCLSVQNVNRVSIESWTTDWVFLCTLSIQNVSVINYRACHWDDVACVRWWTNVFVTSSHKFCEHHCCASNVHPTQRETETW